jgi:alpha-L-fucosidase 2
MKFQIHNNASYANVIWQFYEFTRDEHYLAEFYPILQGLAQFFLEGVVQEAGEAVGIGQVVGVHESPEKVRNDGITLAGTIAILRHCADAAGILGIETDFTRRCADTASRLMPTLDGLFNGSYFKASEDRDTLNMSSMAVIYPMNIIPAGDPRAESTAEAFIARYEGRAVGHGASESAFPWAGGVLATVFAGLGDGDTAWKIIESTRPAICTHGGMTEVMENGEWNMQYFGTAEGAVCTALHHLLLQSEDEVIALFPALPSSWSRASFTNLLAAGLRVTASIENGKVSCSVENAAGKTLVRTIRCRTQEFKVEIGPGETRSLEIGKPS